MTDRTTVHGLQVANELHRFIEDKVLPATGVDSARFWQGFDAIVADLAPKNVALPTRYAKRVDSGASSRKRLCTTSGRSSRSKVRLTRRAATIFCARPPWISS